MYHPMRPPPLQDLSRLLHQHHLAPQTHHILIHLMTNPPIALPPLPPIRPNDGHLRRQ